MLRIFVTSNQISTVFCSTIAKKTQKPGDVDLLLIDRYYKKESLISLIRSSSTIHNWKDIIDFSERKADNFNLKPSLWKRFSRSIKHLPVIRTIYKFFLGIYLNKTEKTHAGIVLQKINQSVDVNSDSPVELFLLTQTMLNEGLIKAFNNPIINYYEHGLVDYLYVLQKKKVNRFYAVFADSYNTYLKNNAISTLRATGYMEHDDMNRAFSGFVQLSQLDKQRNFDRYALILLDASEIFNVPVSFWNKFLECCIAQIENPDSCGIILKPHPGQSNEVMQLLVDFCNKRNNLILLDDPLLVSTSVEGIYISNKESINYVFSTYSAAEFYLARYFEGHTQFYFLHEFVRPYYVKGPKQYADAFNELEPYVNHVFSSNACLFLN